MASDSVNYTSIQATAVASHKLEKSGCWNVLAGKMYNKVQCFFFLGYSPVEQEIKSLFRVESWGKM